MINSDYRVKMPLEIPAPAPATGRIRRRKPETMLNREKRHELPNTEKFFMLSSTFFKEMVLYD